MQKIHSFQYTAKVMGYQLNILSNRAFLISEILLSKLQKVEIIK